LSAIFHHIFRPERVVSVPPSAGDLFYRPHWSPPVSQPGSTVKIGHLVDPDKLGDGVILVKKYFINEGRDYGTRGSIIEKEGSASNDTPRSLTDLGDKR
jgi:hypothetical protein